MAEIREFPMLIASMRRSLNSKNGFNWSRVPKSYTLNSGHVMFFYNKGRWLERRWAAIITEAISRGYNVDPTRMDFEIWHTNFVFGDFNVTDRDIRINVQRISLRVSDKPSWYRYSGALSKDQVLDYYDSVLDPTLSGA